MLKTTAICLLFLSCMALAQDKLKTGMDAPDFTLDDPYGNKYTLSYYEGKNPVVIYFYPQAGTAGCTKQACGIRDNLNEFKDANIKVFGISTDPPQDIEKFIEDYHLNFPLLSDSNKIVSKEYGVLREKGNAKRVTFIIDKAGKINKIIEVKDIESHAATVLEAAKKLN